MRYVGFVFMLVIILGSALVIAPAYGGKAKTQTQTVRIPLEGEIITGECPDAEDVVYSGTLKAVSHVTLDPNGGLHGKNQVNFVNFRGIGQTTGDEYHLRSNVELQSNEFISEDGGPAEITLTTTTHIKDGGISEKVKIVIHLTINANGETTVEKVELKLDCD